MLIIIPLSTSSNILMLERGPTEFSKAKTLLEKVSSFSSLKKWQVTHQQVLGAFVATNEQTYNWWHLAIDEVEEQARQLYNVKQNVDTMRAAMK